MNEDKVVGAQSQPHLIWNAVRSKLSWEPAGSDASVPQEPEPTHKEFLLVCREDGREAKRQVSCYQPIPIRDALRRELTWNHHRVAKHTNDHRDDEKGSPL